MKINKKINKLRIFLDICFIQVIIIIIGMSLFSEEFPSLIITLSILLYFIFRLFILAEQVMEKKWVWLLLTLILPLTDLIYYFVKYRPTLKTQNYK